MGEPTGTGQQGASLLGLLLVVVTLGVMAAVAVAVVRHEQETTDRAVDTAGLPASTSTPSPAGTGSALPSAPAAAAEVACRTEKAALTQAESIGSQLEGHPLTTDELIAGHYLSSRPAYYEVVVGPDGTAAIRSRDLRVCP